MYFTDLNKTKLAETPAELDTKKVPVSVQWLLGEPEGAPSFEMRYLTFPPSAETEYHSHAWEHEVFVVKGQGQLKTEDKFLELKANDAVLLLPGEGHQLRNSSAAENFEIICVVPKGTRKFSCQCG